MTEVALHVDQAFYRVPGGIGAYVRELARALPAADPSLRLTLFHARFPGPPPAWMDGLERHELPRRIASLYPAWALTGRPALPDPIAQADVVHAASPVGVPPVRKGHALVVTVHDLAFRTTPEAFPPRWRTLFRLGLRRAAARADAIIAVSDHTANDIERLTRFPRPKIHVVPLAAALPSGDPDVAAALSRLGVERPYVLFVGTLEPRKNVVRLVRAYRRAVERAGIRHSLVLAGPWGWGSDSLRRELPRASAGRVVLTGRVADDDLDALYRGADLFAYPSLYEGFGLPVLEAMARGIPVIASNAASLPEVAGDAAVLVDPSSTASIESAIAGVLTDRGHRIVLARASRERAKDFSWERTARQTVSVYRSVT